MHAIELALIANIFVRYSASQVTLGSSPSTSAAHAYWLTSRFRHEYWSERLAAHRTAIQRPGVSYRNACWHEIVPVIQEVLLSEPLTRCLAYHAAILEQEQVDFEFTPLANSTLASHTETRHRCLHLIVFGTGLSVELAVQLNRLRRHAEIFSDQLIAAMRPIENMEPFCFDARGTARCQHQLHTDSMSRPCRLLHAAALSEWFSSVCAADIDSRKACGRLNKKLLQSIMELFQPEQFDSFGIPRSQASTLFQIHSTESDGKLGDLPKVVRSPLDLLGLSTKRPELLEPTDRRW